MRVKREIGASLTEEQDGMKKKESFYFILCLCGFHESIFMERRNGV